VRRFASAGSFPERDTLASRTAIVASRSRRRSSPKASASRAPAPSTAPQAFCPCRRAARQPRVIIGEVKATGHGPLGTASTQYASPRKYEAFRVVCVGRSERNSVTLSSGIPAPKDFGRPDVQALVGGGNSPVVAARPPCLWLAAGRRRPNSLVGALGGPAPTPGVENASTGQAEALAGHSAGGAT
jgi:hypothetical protein